jgi:hypothetical protein
MTKGKGFAQKFITRMMIERQPKVRAMPKSTNVNVIG